MTRTTSADDRPRFEGEDDEFYKAILVMPKDGFYKDGDTAAEDFKLRPAIRTELMVQGHKINAYDTMSLALGQRKDGTVSRLRQFLNALAEKERDTPLWFDAQSLEWGYDMNPSSPAYARITAGMELMFRGENRANGDGGKKKYTITGYRSIKAKS